MVKTFEQMKTEYKDEGQKKKIKTALIIALIALLFAVAAAGDVSRFWMNVSGQPQLNESVTFIPGWNIALSQDTINKTITITGANITGGGVSFNGSSVNLNGSTLYNGSVPSDNSKVNKSGDTITGKELNFSMGMRLGDLQLISSQGFQFISPVYNAMFSSYNDSTNMYMGQGLNTYYDGEFTATHGWHKINKNASSVIIQTVVDTINFGTAWSDMYISTPTQTDPYLNFEQVYRMGNKSVTFYPAVTINTLAGSGNAYVCVDSTGKLYRGNPGC